MHHEFREGLDVEDAGGSPATQFGKAVENGLQIVGVCQGALQVIDPSDPMRKTPLLKDGAAHDGKIQVTMRVNEPGHQDAFAEVLNGPRRQVASPPDSDDPTAVQVYNPVLDGGRAKRQDDA